MRGELVAELDIELGVEDDIAEEAVVDMIEHLGEGRTVDTDSVSVSVPGVDGKERSLPEVEVVVPGFDTGTFVGLQDLLG